MLRWDFYILDVLQWNLFANQFHLTFYGDGRGMKGGLNSFSIKCKVIYLNTDLTLYQQFKWHCTSINANDVQSTHEVIMARKYNNNHCL